MTDLTIHTVSADRLAWGEWDHQKGRDLGEGDIHSSYSADIIAQESKVRKPFTFAGSLWVVVGMSGHGGVEQADAYRLIPARMFQGIAATTYREKTGTADGAESARADPLGFYHGMTVKCGKESYVLCGPPALFVAGPERSEPTPQQLPLFAP